MPWGPETEEGEYGALMHKFLYYHSYNKNGDKEFMNAYDKLFPGEPDDIVHYPMVSDKKNRELIKAIAKKQDLSSLAERLGLKNNELEKRIKLFKKAGMVNEL
jgi:hypothetical protein